MSGAAAGLACSAAGPYHGLPAQACALAVHPASVLSAGQTLLTNPIGGAANLVGGTAAQLAMSVAGASVLGAAGFVLRETATVISTTTEPQLLSSWFSASYWEMSAIAMLLTVPFLCAACVQSLLRSDVSLIARAAFVYLPAGMLAIAIAAPVTMMLLAASDEMSALVAGAGGGADTSFLVKIAAEAGAVSLLSHSAFAIMFIALLTIAATITLWIELLIRAAAVYVVVLMLPLFFAALVWPARRIWAVRAIELLVALILSKFAIVAVLSLGGAALAHASFPSPTRMLEGATLVILAAFSPWALLRLLPLHELGAGLEGMGARLQQPLPEAIRPSAALNDATGDLVHRLISGERDWTAAQPGGAGESIAQLARGATGEDDHGRAADAGEPIVSANEPAPSVDEPPPPGKQPWKPPPDTGTLDLEALAAGPSVADEPVGPPPGADTDE